MENSVKIVAICAGSGASVLKGAQADLYLTGETKNRANRRNLTTTIIYINDLFTYKIIYLFTTAIFIICFFTVNYCY